MPLIIDGNNVLCLDAKPAALAGLGELGLCKLLAKSKWAGRGITLVFDGHRGPLDETISPSPQVQIVYSEHKIADDIIIERILKDSAPGNLTVVSSDKEILKTAHKRRCPTMTSDNFLHELVRNLYKSGKTNLPDKPANPHLSEAQVTNWLAEFGIEDQRH